MLIVSRAQVKPNRHGQSRHTLTWTRLLIPTFLWAEATVVPDLRSLSLRRSALFSGNLDDWWGDLVISTVTTGELPSDEIGGGVMNVSRDQEGEIWLVGNEGSARQSWTSGVGGNLNVGGGMVCWVMIAGASKGRERNANYYKWEENHNTTQCFPLFSLHWSAS